MSNKIKLEVLRYRPEMDDKPWAQEFEIEWTHDMSILDALDLVKENMEAELSYRWSCRMEVCGSCGMVINNEPKLACSTFVREYADVGKITVSALDNMPVEKDLIVDVNSFVEKLESIKPYIINSKKKSPEEGANTQTRKELAKFKDYTMCINCMLCYQACPQVAVNAEFLGPAVISMARRYNQDNRDCAGTERFDLLNSKNGVWPCTFVGYCSEVCPKNVDPAGAIQQSKAEALINVGLSMFKKKGGQ